MPTVKSILLSVFGIFLLQLLPGLRRVARNVGNLSGLFFLFSPLSTIGFMIARMIRQIPYIHVGNTWALKRKHEDFTIAGQDAISVITAFPAPQAMIYIADAAAVKEITTYRYRFPKPIFRYKVLSVFGPNIVASYRKITAPAFSERNNKLVWDETIQIMNDLFDNVWGDRSEIIVDHCVDITLPVTWKSDLVVPPGHQMTFKDALHILSTNLIQKIIMPNWAKHLTKHSKNIDLAFCELKQYMLEMVEARRNGDKVEERYDLFSGLLDAARDKPDNGAGLNDEELIGNMFIFLIAGHETTAHTLCFTFALLALYPDEQERLYQHIKGVMSNLNGTPASFRDLNSYSRFTQSLAVFYETLRMLLTARPQPPDTTFTVGNVDGGMTTFPVPSGTQIDIHVPGLHYNPRYWEQPHKFMPERFLGDWPKDAFLSFSQECSHNVFRFFETEGIAILTMLVSRYKIEVKEEPEFAGETFEERYARITAFDQGLTTIPLRVPLVFKRR
ncbi:cytochrome P450 monooxygenase [Russula decolorans]